MIENLEFAVLGGLMLDNSRFSEIDLLADDFADSTHGQIFEAIGAIIADGSNADPVTVGGYLERTSRIPLTRVTRLVENTPSASNVVHYAKMVKAEARRRKAIAIAAELQNGLQEDGIEAVDVAIRELMALNTSRKSYECAVSEAVALAAEAIETAHKNKGQITGIASGLTDLDERLGGFQNSDLYVIGARPACGKTSFLLNIADNADVPVGVMSGEQGRSQVGLRLIAKNGRINAHKLRLGKVDDTMWPTISKAIGKVSARQIWINDKPNPSIEEVVRQARKWAFQHGIRALYIDYIQRIRALPKSPRHEQVGYVVLSLKELARELDIPVIALAQVNREVESRDDKRPRVSDLKDSGGIEQEADNIMLLYRDEVYNETSEHKGIMEINVGKNRHGPTGLIKVAFHGESMSFGNLANVRY